MSLRTSAADPTRFPPPGCGRTGARGRARPIAVALRLWAIEHGCAPLHDEWLAAGRTHPPASTVKKVFGGWTAALHAAGLVPAVHGVWMPEQVLHGLRAFERVHGHPPRRPDLRNTRGAPYPPATAVTRAWGSMHAAYRQLGSDACWTAVSDTDILGALRAYEREHGRPPTVTVWRREHRRPGASVVIRRYGSWSGALAAAAAAGRDVSPHDGPFSGRRPPGAREVAVLVDKGFGQAPGLQKGHLAQDPLEHLHVHLRPDSGEQDRRGTLYDGIEARDR
jgi:hypothetical protein